LHYAEVKRALRNGDAAGAFGDRLFSEARDERKWNELRTSSAYRPWIEDVRAEGERLVTEPIEALTFSAYKLFDTKGSRIEFERQYFSRRKRLSVLAFLALLDGEPKWLEAVEDAIWAICDEYAWALPAHLGGTSLLPPEAKRHRCTIDLFAAETAFALAEIVSLLRERLSAAVAHRAENEIRERVLEPYCALGSAFWWETADNNWASVCAASVGASALYLIPNADELAPIVHRLLGTFDSYLEGFGDDGACTEGVGYWMYGFGFYMYFAELLRQRTAGTIDLMSHEKAKPIALFHEACYLSGMFTVPFSDCETTARYSPGLIHALKRRFPDVHVPPYAQRSDIASDPIGRWGPFIRDFVWSEAAWQGEDWPDATYVLPDAQWFVARMTSDGSRLALAAKGGHNGEPHNHNDIGSFVLHIDGESLLCDLGSGEYTKGYFGEERFSYLCNGSQGHSVPIVEGCFQGTGDSFRAQILRVEEGERHRSFAVDLTKAYDVPKLVSLVREFTVRLERNFVLDIEDAYEFRTAPSSVTSRWITLYEPRFIDGIVQIEGEQSGVRIAFDDEAWRPVARRFEFVNKHSERVTVYAIDLGLRQPAARLSFTMHARFECYKLKKKG